MQNTIFIIHFYPFQEFESMRSFDAESCTIFCPTLVSSVMYSVNPGVCTPQSVTKLVNAFFKLIIYTYVWFCSELSAFPLWTISLRQNLAHCSFALLEVCVHLYAELVLCAQLIRATDKDKCPTNSLIIYSFNIYTNFKTAEIN